MSLATEVLDAFRQVATAAEGTPFATQALADAEHVGALIPKEVDAAESVVKESEQHVIAWLTKRLHPEAAAPGISPTKPAPEPLPTTTPVSSSAPVTSASTVTSSSAPASTPADTPTSGKSTGTGTGKGSSSD